MRVWLTPARQRFVAVFLNLCVILSLFLSPASRALTFAPQRENQAYLFQETEPPPTATPSAAGTNTATPTGIILPTDITPPALSVTPDVTSTATVTPVVTSTASPTVTLTQGPVAGPTYTPPLTTTPTVTPTATAVPTVTQTPTLTVTPPVTITTPATTTPAVSVTLSATVAPSATVSPAVTITLTVTVTPTSQVGPTATITPAIEPTATPTPEPAVVLLLSKTVTPSTPVSGQVVTFTLVVSNTGSRDAQSLLLQDPLPMGLEFVPGSAPGADYDARTALLSWQIAALKAGGTEHLSFAVRVADLPGTTVTNTAMLSRGREPTVLTATARLEVAQPDRQARVSPGEGGNLVSEDGRVRVRFGPGAVRKAVLADVEVQQVTFAQRARHEPFYQFDLTAVDEIGRTPVARFDQPITVTVAYSETQIDGLIEDSLRMVYWDEAQEQWAGVPSRVDVEANVVTARLDHFSLFGLVADDEVFFQPGIEAGQVSQFTGDAAYSHDLEVPAGAGGLKVPLTLQYSSGIANGLVGSGNTDTGWVGVGWRLDPGSIRDDVLTMGGLSADLVCSETLSTDNQAEEQVWDDGATSTYKGTRTVKRCQFVNERFWTIELTIFSSDCENKVGCSAGRDIDEIHNKREWHLWDKNGTEYIFGSDTVTETQPSVLMGSQLASVT